jgi:signal transduction histidine kinase
MERLAGALADASREVSETLQELRELARGIHPAVLIDRGLDAALEAVAARVPRPVELRATPGERLPEPIGDRVLHRRRGAHQRGEVRRRDRREGVSVERAKGRLLVRVEDNGIGGADMRQGSGSRGLSDRAEALRGTLRVDSPAGRGTVATAELPVGIA